MSGFISTVVSNAILGHLVGKSSLGALVSPVYLALCTTAPTVSAFGTEVTGLGYARQSMSGSDWGTASNRRIANAATETFSASGNWSGPIVGWGLFTAASGGTYIAGGLLERRRIVKSLDTLTFAAGSIVLRTTDVNPTSGISDAAVHKMLEHIVGKTTWAFSSGTCHVGMTSTVPTDEVPGTEPTGGSYARQNITAAQWNSAASRSIATNAAKTLTAGVDAVIRGYVLFDAVTAGNYLGWYKLPTAVRLTAGQTMQVSSGSTVALPAPA